VGLRLVAVADRPARLVRARVGARAHAAAWRARDRGDRPLYGRWPFLASLVDNAELSLARADLGVGRQYAGLRRRRPGRVLDAIEAEYVRTVAWLGRVTGRDRLLDHDPELRRRLGLRGPVRRLAVGAQVTLLGRLRATPPDDPDARILLRLVQLTVNGIAAGLQRTG
jgi:phosphoenolpyruvate carboxylase